MESAGAADGGGWSGSGLGSGVAAQQAAHEAACPAAVPLRLMVPLHAQSQQLQHDALNAPPSCEEFFSSCLPRSLFK